MYSASKHALTVVNEGVRRELREMKSNVKITVSTQINRRYAFRHMLYTVSQIVYFSWFGED